jgi:hypothetical protein
MDMDLLSRKAVGDIRVAQAGCSQETPCLHCYRMIVLNTDTKGWNKGKGMKGMRGERLL